MASWADEEACTVEAVAEAWQHGKTMMDRHRHMLEHAIAADVRFRLGSEDVWAHMFVLASCSPVFEAMVNKPARKEGRGNFVEIKVKNIQPEALKEILRYLYYEQMDLTVPLAVNILYAAHKYQLSEVLKKAEDFLTMNCNLDNVCSILNQAVLCDMKDLSEVCLAKVRRQAATVLQSPGVLDLSRKALYRLVSDDGLRVETERHVYECCLRWAMNKCVESEALPTDELLREHLGEVLYQIRFTLMGQTDFMEISTKSSVLTAEEKGEVYKALIGKGDKSSRFENRQRERPMKYSNTPVIVNRLASVAPQGGLIQMQTSDKVHAISFKTDKDCLFLGVGMLVEPNQTLPVSLTVFDGSQSIVADTDTEDLSGNSLCNYLCNTSYSGQVNLSSIPLYLQNPLFISADEVYTVQAKAKYTPSVLAPSYSPGYYTQFTGQGGQANMSVKGTSVSFTLPNFVQNNLTQIAGGQLPQLFFKFQVS